MIDIVGIPCWNQSRMFSYISRERYMKVHSNTYAFPFCTFRSFPSLRRVVQRQRLPQCQTFKQVKIFSAGKKKKKFNASSPAKPPAVIFFESKLGDHPASQHRRTRFHMRSFNAIHPAGRILQVSLRNAFQPVRHHSTGGPGLVSAQKYCADSVRYVPSDASHGDDTFRRV